MNDKQYQRETFDPTAYRKEDAPRKEEPDAKPVENKALLPDPADPYKADGFVGDEASCLVLIMGKDGFLAGETAYFVFQYVHIGMGQFGFTASGQWFSYVFSDIQPKLVTVHGRNLLRMYHQIGLRRVPWIRQADRDYRQPGVSTDTEPFISRLKVEDWKRQPEQAAKLAEILDVHGVES